MGRNEQCPYLVGGEAHLREVVLVLRDAVALLHLPSVGRRQLDRYAHVAEGVLVPLEHALGRCHVALLVGGHQRPDLFEGERPPGFQEEGNQIDQALQWMHQPRPSSRSRSSEMPKK